MSVNSRWQALQLCFDAPVVVVIQIGNQFLFEVFHGIEILEIEQFALQQTEEVFDHSIIQAVTFPAHALDHSIIGQFLLVMLVLILPALIRMKNRCCPRGQLACGAIEHVHDH